MRLLQMKVIISDATQSPYRRGAINRNNLSKARIAPELTTDASNVSFLNLEPENGGVLISAVLRQWHVSVPYLDNFSCSLPRTPQPGRGRKGSTTLANDPMCSRLIYGYPLTRAKAYAVPSF